MAQVEKYMLYMAVRDAVALAGRRNNGGPDAAKASDERTADGSVTAYNKGCHDWWT